MTANLFSISFRSVVSPASHLTSDLLTQTAGTAMTPLPLSPREPLSPSYWPQVRPHLVEVCFTGPPFIGHGAVVLLLCLCTVGIVVVEVAVVV